MTEGLAYEPPDDDELDYEEMREGLGPPWAAGGEED
jgi:hypothetical protein